MNLKVWWCERSGRHDRDNLVAVGGPNGVWLEECSRCGTPVLGMPDLLIDVGEFLEAMDWMADIIKDEP